MRRTALALVLALALLVRLLPAIEWRTVMGVDAYYHMRLAAGYVVHDSLYAGTRTAVYPPLFHLLMRPLAGVIEQAALILPPLLSTATVGTLYWTLRDDARLATLAAFLMAVHPAVLMRVYFFPELLALFLMPFGYYALSRSSARGHVGAGVVLLCTHTLGALFYLASVLAWPHRPRLRRATVALLAAGLAWALLPGPSVSRLAVSAPLPFLYGLAFFAPCALYGWGAGTRLRGYQYAAAFALLAALAVPSELATHRIGALAAAAVVTSAALGLKRLSVRSAPALAVVLAALCLVSFSYVGARDPIYRAEDRAGAAFVGGTALSPVASTAGHLVTFYGATVLVDEYAQYAPGHAERLAATLGVIMRNAKDYALLDREGVRYLFAERCVTAPTAGQFPCIYDSGARVYVLSP